MVQWLRTCLAVQGTRVQSGPGRDHMLPTGICWIELCFSGVLASGFPGGSEGKVFACSAGDPGSIPASGRSPGERNGNAL